MMLLAAGLIASAFGAGHYLGCRSRDRELLDLRRCEARACERACELAGQVHALQAEVARRVDPTDALDAVRSIEATALNGMANSDRAFQLMSRGVALLGEAVHAQVTAETVAARTLIAERALGDLQALLAEQTPGA